MRHLRAQDARAGHDGKDGAMDAAVQWHRVAEVGTPEEGRVRTVVAGETAVCLTRYRGRLGALDNRCPHQGGPLGEGSIEQGLLRCPWHGYDYDPVTGEPPPPFTDRPAAFPVEERADGVYVGVPEPSKPPRTVSDVLVETMQAWGVTHVFGMVGHSNLGFAEAMRRAEQRGTLTYVGIRHEGAASFAASAYAKLTGRLGACFAIAGPGSTNLMTGLYDARADGAPVLAVSGQVPSKALGQGAFQDLNLRAAFADVAAYSAIVLPDSDHAEVMARACKSALGSRGVGHLVVPDEVQVQAADAAAAPPEGRWVTDRPAPPAQSLAAARRALAAARRPVFVLGNGARSGIAEAVALAEAVGAPMITTFRAKGIIPDQHPLAGGVLGRSGTPVASWLMNESDLLVVLGASFAHHTGISPYKPTVQVDVDPMTLGRFRPVDVPVLADIAATCRALLGDLPAGDWHDQRADVAARWQIWREEKQRRADDDHGNGIASAAVFAALQTVLPTDAVMAVDVGNNTYSFGRYLEMQRQDVVMSGYLGSIGFALPAAMGAWAAVQDDIAAGKPARKVVSVSGDGGFGQYLAEMTTLVQYDMDITHVVLTNGQLGKISKEQRAAQYPVWQTSLVNPDFAAYATSCGALGIRVEHRRGLADAFARAIAHPGPALVEVMADPALV
jgi:pyruvate oxidase